MLLKDGLAICLENVLHITDDETGFIGKDLLYILVPSVTITQITLLIRVSFLSVQDLVYCKTISKIPNFCCMLLKQ